MTYQLGIDLGTTYTAAAVYHDGRVEVAALGDRAAAIPTVLFVRDGEDAIVGEAANRRALTEPGRVAREFKRRVGDTTPVILGGSPYSAEALMAQVLRWVVDTVGRQQGEGPEQVTVSHPANWGPYKREVLGNALHMAGLEDATTITEPEAAAIFYASNERVESGSVVAVYDLGGGTFDSAVLRKTETGFEILGSPEGIEHLGGIDFDQAVYAHVNRALDGALDELDPDDPAALAAAARLRQECAEAKEALSTDTDTSIPVLLPSLQTEVRLTRSEFESMIRPALSETIEALRRALHSAGVEPSEVSKVLLVGGSSRIPLVAQMISAELGRPVAVDAHPKHAVALGAAIAAATEAGESDALAVATVAPPPEEATAALTGADVAAAGLATGAAGAAGAAAAMAETEPLAGAGAGGAPTVPLPGGGGGGGGPTEVLPDVAEPPPTGPIKRRSKGRVALVVLLILALVGGGAFAYITLVANKGKPVAAASPSPKKSKKPRKSPTPSQQPETHAPPPSPSPSPEGCTETDPAALEETDNAFTPEFITVCSLQGLEITNNGAVLHNFSISDAGIDLDTNPGEFTNTESIGGSLAPGMYHFTCKYHIAEGMVGTITVLEAASG